MKSRKVKSVARGKAFMKKLKSNIPIETDDNSFEENEFNESSDDEEFQQKHESSSEEEVLPISDGESSSSDNENEEENSEEDDLPDLNNWGKKKSTYFNADFVDKDRGKTYREEDQEIENAEREAALLQQQNSVELDKYESSVYFEDYDRAIELMSQKPETETYDNELENDDNPEIEKIKHEQRKYPQFQEYKERFSEKFNEINNKLAPLLELFEKVKLDEGFMFFIKLKYQVLNHYLLNLSFYFYMKCAEGVPENHPVYERIEQFKEIDDKLNTKKNYLKEIDYLVEKLSKKEQILPEIPNEKISTSKNKKGKKEKVQKSTTDSKISKNKVKHIETDNEKEIFELYKNMKNHMKKMELDKNGILIEDETNMDVDTNYNVTEENTVDGKRTITYQIAKNKGLVAKKKKECRNPRVHHRMKYRKAKIRRKGQVREVIKEIKRYAGEPTGISAHVVRSIKLK